MSSSRLKVLTIFGTRPEAVKMAPVIKELQRRSGQIETKICVTAQHRDLLDQVLGVFQIQPDYDLQIMKERQSLSYLTANILTRLDPILQEEKPDWILVQGDTTTVMAGALAGFYHRIRVGHIEAGLRTGDKYSPYPEEINRRITGQIANLHFAPTEWTRDNLLREGFAPGSVHVTGNTVIDALFDIVAREAPAFDDPLWCRLQADRRLILVTAHRRENFGAPFEEICSALMDLAQAYSDSIQIVYPVHPNPHVRERAYERLGAIDNILLTEPVEYLSFAHLMKRAYLMLTDSGGIQEEGPSLGVPVLVLRESTERPEGVAAGTLRLVGSDRRRIVEEASRLLDDPAEYARMAHATNPFGDGHASERIVDLLCGCPTV